MLSDYITIEMHGRKRHARDVPFVKSRGRRIGMCGYTSVPEDGRTCYFNFIDTTCTHLLYMSANTFDQELEDFDTARDFCLC